MLKAGQNLLLNNRVWTLRQVEPKKGRILQLEAIGASEASMGMTRRMTAYIYGQDLFIAQRRGSYQRANLAQDWIEGDWGPVLECQPATALNLLDTHTQYPAQGKLKNRFSWSYSRQTKYQHCPRAYYYHYYAAWEGWRKDAPPPVKQTYLLKNLSNIPAWQGLLVHESIKFAMARLKAGTPVAKVDLLKQMQRRATTDFKTSQSGKYKQKPNQLLGLQEHHYHTQAEPWPILWAKAEQLLQTFLNSTLYAELCRQPAPTFLNVEELQSFLVGGVKVWVQMDLACYTKGTIYLYDWKTGRIDETALQQQLGVYGLYARQTWPEKQSAPIKAVVYAIAEDRVLEFDIDETILQQTRPAIQTDTAQLQNLLADKHQNLAQLRRFPMIDDLTVCQHCQFRALCERE